MQKEYFHELFAELLYSIALIFKEIVAYAQGFVKALSFERSELYMHGFAVMRELPCERSELSCAKGAIIRASASYHAPKALSWER